MTITVATYAPTRVPWYNDVDGAKIACYAGKYKDIPYGQHQTRTRLMHKQDGELARPHPQYGSYQFTGIACAPQLFTIIHDGDYPENWAGTATGKLLGDWRKVATSIREYVKDGVTRWKFHNVVYVPQELHHLWPKQRATEVGGDVAGGFGHIKSNGFSYDTGVCCDGSEYVQVNGGIIATEDLMRAQLIDNGGILDSDRGAASSDSFDADVKTWTEPDGSYDQDIANEVLGGWIENTRNDSLPRRCGMIKAAGEMGRTGMRTLFSELCAEYDAEKNQGDADVYAAYSRCYPAYAKVGRAVQPSWMTDQSAVIDTRYAAAVAASPVQVAEPSPEHNGNLSPNLTKVAVPADLPGNGTSSSHAGPVAECTPPEFDPVGRHTDQELADACLHAVSPQYQYAGDAQVWITAEGERWVQQPGDMAASIVTELAKLMPRGLTDAKAKADGLNLADPAVQAELGRGHRWERFQTSKTASGIATKIRSLVARAGHHPSSLYLADLDNDPDVIWGGGVPYSISGSLTGLAVATGVDRKTPHLLSCRYMPKGIPTPLWDHLTAVMWPIPEVREWALNQLAQAVTGRAEKALPVFSGEGDTGKTSVVEAIVHVLGNYAAPVSSDLLNNTSGRTDEYSRFDLKGLRLAFMDEAPRTGKIAQENLKNLTGGGSQKGRPIYGKPISFTATHTIVTTANPDSDPPMTDEAVVNRVRIVPCHGDISAVRLARRAMFPLTSAAWQEEAPGVLAKMIMRAAAVVADPDCVLNHRSPENVAQWTSHIAGKQNTVAAWFFDATEPSQHEVRGGELREDYYSWCKRNNISNPVTPSVWGKKMTPLMGSPGRVSNSATWYLRKSIQRDWRL